MKQDAFLNFDMPWMPITGLIIFFICFSAYFYWTYKKENKHLYEEISLIPLEDEARGLHE